MYGYKGVKWLTKMEVVAKQPRGYWERHGYDQNAWVGRSHAYSAWRPPVTALQPPRARAALGARERLLRPLRLGALPLPAEPGAAGRPAAAAEGHPRLHGARLAPPPWPL